MILLLLASLASANTCYMYECNQNKISMSSSTCIYFQGNTYFLQACTDTTAPYCQPTFGIQNVTCSESPSSNKPTAYPGEFCSSDESCVYGFCYNFKCSAQSYGGNCATHLECNPGLMCHQGRCSNQLKVGQNCTEDFQCQNNAGCDGTCKKYLSVTNQNWVHSCAKDGKSMICQSGFCLNGYCLPAPKSLGGFRKVCDTNAVCKSTDFGNDGITLYSECVCGMNSQGLSFCDLFPGDSPYQDMVAYVAKWTATNEVLMCNTARRWDRGCMDTVWNKNDADMFGYYQTVSNNYPQLAMIEKCVGDIVYPGVLEIEDSLDSFGVAISIAVFYLFY